jgi:hypothetical protein
VYASGIGGSGASLTNNDGPDHTHATAISGNTGNGNGFSGPFSLLHPVIAFNYPL